MDANTGPSVFFAFAEELAQQGLAGLRGGLIGKDVCIEGPWGKQRMIYADYVASGRALAQLEAKIMHDVLPFYANSHTQASHCGALMTQMRAAARSYIAAQCGANEQDYAVIFGGSGATAGINRLVDLLGVRDAVESGRSVRIIIGPYEHHSNILPWRESGADVIEIAESDESGPALRALEHALSSAPKDALTIGSFSAASNVTGIISDVTGITRMLKSHGALAVWDYAGGGPYLPIAMQSAPDAAIDAIVVSPHKFIGGPGASGVMVVRRNVCTHIRPTQPGGGTVTFVSPWGHDYNEKVEAREEAGTPNVVGDIRAALAFATKAAIGRCVSQDRNNELAALVFAAWRQCDRLEILGSHHALRLPIFSFRVRDAQGDYVHHQLVTRLLSDRYGIQARGGCACAGSYVHQLLDLDRAASDAIRTRIQAGDELEKPGFVRLNLSVLMDDDDIDFIIDSVSHLAREAPDLGHLYVGDPATAIFRPVSAMHAQ